MKDKLNSYNIWENKTTPKLNILSLIKLVISTMVTAKTIAVAPLVCGFTTSAFIFHFSFFIKLDKMNDLQNKYCF